VPARQPAAPLGPAHERKPAHALRVQPTTFFRRGEIEIGFRPEFREVVFRPVELRRAQPILPRQLKAVAHAHATLLGRIDEEQTAKRPEGLSAQILFTLLIDDDHTLATIGGFRGRDQSRKAGAHDQDIAIHDEPSRRKLTQA
jgi:hypothetical protein